MAVPNFVPPPVQGISGPGPYAIPHPYEAGDIGVLVLHREARIELSEAEFRLIPPASATGGELLLAPETAARLAGGLLLPFRQGRLSQDWGRAGGGRHGLEAQLDLIVRALQDQTRRLDAALRLDLPVAPLQPEPGRPLVGTETGGLDWGRTAVETAETAAAMLAEAGVIATPVPWPGKAEFLSAPINPATRLARVMGDGLELVYRRDPAGGTRHSDGSRWQLLSGADYPDVASLRAARHPFDPGDRLRAGGFGYVTLAAGGTAAPDLATAGGTALTVEQDRDGHVDLDAFGAAGDGRTDDSAALTRAIARGKVRLGPRTYAVNEIQPVSGMRIEGPGGELQAGRYGLVCTVEGGAIFRDRDDKPIYSVVLEGFFADARAPRVLFYDSPSQKKYSGGFRIRRLEISNEFQLLFRCVPIYWLIDDCRFGFFGTRQGKSQEFRVFEAWSDSTGCPVNLNRVTDTTHYHCAAGKSFSAAYTLRCGASWTFENCSAEQFDSAFVVDARSFSTLLWRGGWIEHINAPTVFRSSVDKSSPYVLNGTPLSVDGTKFYIGNKTCLTLVDNRNGLVSLSNINILGHDPAFRAVSNPWQVALLRNVYHGQTLAFETGVIEQGRVAGGRFSPWRNGIAPARLGVSSPALRVTEHVSDLTGETTSLLHLPGGSRGLAVTMEVPLRLLAPVWNGYLTIVGIGAWETAGKEGRQALAAYWANADPAGPPTVMAAAEQALARTDTGLGLTRVTSFVPADPRSFHIGLILETADAADFVLEGLHLLMGNAICNQPFFA